MIGHNLVQLPDDKQGSHFLILFYLKKKKLEVSTREESILREKFEQFLRI